MVLAARHQHFPTAASPMSVLDSRLDHGLDSVLDRTFGGELDASMTNDGDLAVRIRPTPHQVAEVSDRGLVLIEALAPLDARLRALHGRIVSAVVRGGPLPVACETLPEIDHLVARIEVEWNETMRAGSRRDPDLEQWSRCLLAATEGCFTNWCFACLCELSGGGLIRIDADRGDFGEAWVADEPTLLAADLATALDGDRIDLAVDPLRRPETTAFQRSLVRQAS
ncbi:MAG: hypothetical protein CMJ22_04905 [Phycisphaerae bacterium]|nr:hypothetical protein [Phycisphaerae bacterium]